MSLNGSVRQCRSGTSSGLEKPCQLNEGPVLHGKVDTMIVLQGYQLIIVLFLQLGCKSFWLFLSHCHLLVLQGYQLIIVLFLQLGCKSFWLFISLCHWFIIIGCIYYKGVLLRCQNWSVQPLSESVLQLKKLSFDFCRCMYKCTMHAWKNVCEIFNFRTVKILKMKHRKSLHIKHASLWSLSWAVEATDRFCMSGCCILTRDVKYLVWNCIPSFTCYF